MDSIVATVIAACGGGAGLTAILTTIFNYRKYKAEAQTLQVQNSKTEMEYITNALKDINAETKRQFDEFKEAHRAEMDELKESNRQLTHKVEVLNERLSSLMKWVQVDDARYRSILEGRIKELDPSFDFPALDDPPDVFAGTE